MTDFSDRVEGEIKTHEKEMIRKAVILKYGSKDLIERIQYVMSIHKKDHWTEEEMFEMLKEHGLIGTNSVNDVKDALTNPSIQSKT